FSAAAALWKRPVPLAGGLVRTSVSVCSLVARTIGMGAGLTTLSRCRTWRRSAGNRFEFSIPYLWNRKLDIEPVPDLATVGGQQVRVFDSIDIREYRYYRSRWGIAGSADYKLKEGSNIYGRYIYSDFHNYADRWVYTINDNLYGNGGPPSFNDQIRRPDYAIGSVLLGGKHVL